MTVYDLRNKGVRMRQNVVFAIKNTKKFWGGGTLIRPLPQWGGVYPLPTSTPSAPAAPRPLPFYNPGYATGRNGCDKGIRHSRDFWGRQNCRLPRAPITHVRYLADLGPYHHHLLRQMAAHKIR